MIMFNVQVKEMETFREWKVRDYFTNKTPLIFGDIWNTALFSAFLIQIWKFEKYSMISVPPYQVSTFGIVVSIAVLEPGGPGSNPLQVKLKPFFLGLSKLSNFHEEGRIKSSVSNISKNQTEFFWWNNL